MNSLLLEIGTEEIPAGYIEPALKALSAQLLQKMSEARIEHGDAMVYGTPRRLVVEVASVADKQRPFTTELIGPPARVGFDQEGNPTVAAEKFAEKVGIPVNRIKTKDTPKGAYLYATKTERGLASRTLLKDILPEVILSTPFPKTMRWSNLSVNFARPIHSILALLGETIIPFGLGNIKSGRNTTGHSFMHSGKIKVSDPKAYRNELRAASVLVDIEERKNIVKRDIAEETAKLGGRVLPDPALVDIVTNLVEYPAVVVGQFDIKFLELPREILITAMREHQKYFAVIDENDNLMPCFVAVNNTRVKDMALAAKGHERVLRARLEDARFFFRSDLETSLEELAEKLKGVLFQAKLGSVYEKTLRLQEITEFLADKVDGGASIKSDLIRTAFLCKADLVSQVVGEFPKLQGVMGKVYASIAKEPETVAAAIEEHYRPTYSGGPLPETMTGALLAIADKIDSICGCFSVGLAPTGASDPYALRRQAIGIIQIMLHKGLSFSLKALIEKSLALFRDKSDQEGRETAAKVYRFLQNRMAHLLAEEGFSKDVIAAVLNVSVDHVPNVWNRVRALENLKAEPDFEPLAAAFKRVVNIIKKSSPDGTVSGLPEVDESLFQQACETALYTDYGVVKRKVTESLEKGVFDQALRDIASLRNTVDSFFDGVMVMTEDRRLRENRLALLGTVATLFEDLADFSKIST